MGIRWEWKRELLHSRWIGSFPFGLKGLIRKFSQFPQDDLPVMKTHFSFIVIKMLFSQITCYSHKDDNNKWLVKKAYEDYSKFMAEISHSSLHPNSL